MAGCAARNNCPAYPLPTAHVQARMDTLAAEDPEVWAWGNQLLDLCQALGTCEDEE